MADDEADAGVGGIAEGLADCFPIHLDTHVGKGIGQAEERIRRGVVGVLNGFAGEATDFLQGIGVDVIACDEATVGEADERGFLLRGFSLFEEALDDTVIGAIG